MDRQLRRSSGALCILLLALWSSGVAQTPARPTGTLTVFAAVDVALRDTLRQELVQVQARWGITTLVVTHDLADVLALGQRVIVYDGGCII